jgi:UDP-2-acetamido-3-amino-2,3-dideoxy-glucuronate N-acetyltransferase
MSPSAATDLGVGGAVLHRLPRFDDERGALTVAEVAAVVGFAAMRLFVVSGVPAGVVRGGHAHRRCHQLLLCAHGSCRVVLDDGHRRADVVLDGPGLALHLPPLVWATQEDFDPGAVLCVLASEPYDAAEYIRDRDEFLALVGDAAR